MNAPVQALLFDFGNVVISVDFEHTFEAWGKQSGRPAAWFRERFSMDEAYQRHERGEISGSQYFTHLRQHFKVDLSEHDWVSGWNAVLRAETPGLRPLLQAAKKHWPLFLFSNTNSTHKAVWMKRHADVLALFDRVFTSDELGLRKPEAAAFRSVCDSIGFNPQSVLLFDDAPENVAGARLAGLRAVQVQSVKDVAAALQEILRP